jgi:alkaline phosphatase
MTYSKSKFLAFYLFFITLIISGCISTKVVYVDKELPALQNQVKQENPKNIILMIGDGMGITQITAGLISNKGSLNLERIKNIGLHKSFAYNDLVTDSAAGATAFSCGVKTYNGAIGVDHDTIAIKTILEEAEDRGLETGLVATSTIVHATPASFISHNKYRRNYEEIALDMMNVDAEVLIGGGKKFFDRREDEKRLDLELVKNNYIVKSFLDEDIKDLKLSPKQKLVYFTSDKDPLPYSQGREYLLPASQLAIQQLEDSESGFFLMIEGSQIDWGGHANNSDYIISEMKEFDSVIGAVLDWAEKDGETLVIITADHETGGFSINEGTTFDSIVSGFTTTKHTADMIPVFAYGPGSDSFRGIYHNTDIYHKMKLLFGWAGRRD